jgi:hypothetical protein
MKYLSFIAIFSLVLLTGCKNAHQVTKTAEANVFNGLHATLGVYCLLPETIREQEIQELSRDLWQRGYNEDGSEAFVFWLHCPGTFTVDWDADIFEDLPPINTEFLKDTGWEPGECPTEWSDYGCPEAALEARKAERRALEAAKKEAEAAKKEAQEKADRITADNIVEAEKDKAQQ